MDETLTHPARAEQPQVPEEILKDLESSRRLLYEEDYVPDGLDEKTLARTTEIGADGELRLSNQERAFIAMNNFVLILSEKLSGMAAYAHVVEKPQPVYGGRSLKQLVEDKNEIINQMDLPQEDIKQRAARFRHEPDKILELYQDTFPVFEKLVTDKGYTPTALRM